MGIQDIDYIPGAHTTAKTFCEKRCELCCRWHQHENTDYGFCGLMGFPPQNKIRMDKTNVCDCFETIEELIDEYAEKQISFKTKAAKLGMIKEKYKISDEDYVDFVENVLYVNNVLYSEK